MHSKQQQAVPHKYVQQAVYSSNKQCSKPYAAVAASSVAISAAVQQQRHKQPYSYLQHTPAPHNYYYCTRMQFRSSSSSTLLSTLLYIAEGKQQQTKLVAVALLLLLLLFVVAKYVLYGIICAGYVHKRTCTRKLQYIILNLFLCTHDMQQHRVML